MAANNTNLFGMFVHWGIYAQLGLHEQAFARYDIDRAEYEKLAETFNPVEYDPDEWVIQAKANGAKYICFTAKHHDGFCMWDTKTTDYSIMHTPYGRDVLKMLADACARHDMRLSIYYSNPDWHYEYGYNPASTHQWKARTDTEPDTEKLRAYIKAQVTELLTNYGPVYTLFWDIPPHIFDPSINELARRLQPGILINDRGFDTGDFSTPERDFSKTNAQRYERMTEACNSISALSWGYRERDDFYTLRFLMSHIDRVMAMGGSYLLNVGPDAAGNIPRTSAERMRRIGDWYNRMEGCLEGHETDPFDYGKLRASCIINRKNGKTYLHFPDGLMSTGLTLEQYPAQPRSVRLMNSGRAIPWEISYLPALFKPDQPQRTCLHIYDIPADLYADEPIVIEVEWDR